MANNEVDEVNNLSKWEAVVGEKVGQYFKYRNMSQLDVARALGVSKAYVNSLFLGKSRFGRRTAHKFEEAFGFNPIWLMTGEGSMMIHECDNPDYFKMSSGTDAVSVVPSSSQSDLIAVVNKLLVELSEQRKQIQSLIDIVKKKEDIQ